MRRIVLLAIVGATILFGGCDWAGRARSGNSSIDSNLEWRPYTGSAQSGVMAYQIGDDFIRIQFRNQRVYTYSSKRISPDKIEHMKQLAVAGHGLNSFINQNPDVRHGFDLE